MSDSDIQFKDDGLVPKAFAPEAKDLGTRFGLPVRRPLFGSADGAHETFGAKPDEPWDGVTAAPSLVAIFKSLFLGVAKDGKAGTGLLPPTGGFGLLGYLSGIHARTPPLGQASKDLSVPVVLASDAPLALSMGAKSDAPAPTDIANASFFALLKRALQTLSGIGALLDAIHGNQPAAPALDGTDATGVAAPAGGSGIRGWLSGIYDRQAGGLGYRASGKAPVTGSFVATGASVWFQPLPGRTFNLSLKGDFDADVHLERSFDGGATGEPVTVAGQQICFWAAPCSEQWSEDEAGVLYRLGCSRLGSGIVIYRISQ